MVNFDIEWKAEMIEYEPFPRWEIRQDNHFLCFVFLHSLCDSFDIEHDDSRVVAPHYEHIFDIIYLRIFLNMEPKKRGERIERNLADVLNFG